jgi:hypothetical protein
MTDQTGPDRREILRWMAAAAAMMGSHLNPASAFASTGGAPAGPGYGKDPNLLAPVRPWPLTLTRDQRSDLEKAADVILPGEGEMPAASKLKIADFFDEWLSAPYPEQTGDRAAILPLMARLRTAAAARGWPKAVAEALDKSSPDHGAADRLRSLVAGACYTTPEGMRAVGYVGNVVLDRFDGPPPQVVSHFEREVAKLRKRA